MSLKPFDLGKIEVQGAAGMDAFFAREPQHVTPTGSRIRVASIQQLAGFVRLGAETLIHRSDKDLWAISKDADGSMVIERMFDDNGEPLKG